MNAEDFRKLKHELRTPVNHILGYSELLLESAADAGDGNIESLAQQIQNNGQNLARVMEKGLIFTGSEAGDEAQLTTLRTSLLPLVQQILAVSAPGPDSPGMVGYADDLKKIHSAADRLISLIS
ncbi:MAG TPA: histidine kinase dimerization/phospho-acceptor domain-containing protein [Candidatus Angelobacter sp.]|jgi:signal transduction histidine kinase